MRTIFYFIFIVFICPCLLGQEDFRYYYSDPYNSEGIYGIETFDSCYIAVGNIDEFIKIDTFISDCIDCPYPYDTIIDNIITSDILIIKTDIKGDTLWTKRIGREGHEWSYMIAETRDKGYIIGGIDSSYNGNVIKLDKFGNVEWINILDNRSPEKIIEIDSFYIVLGTKSHVIDGDADMYAQYLDAMGNEHWIKEYGESGVDQYIYAEIFNAACLGNDSNIFMVGENKHDLIFYNIDFSGNIKWQGRYGGEEGERAVGIVQTDDNNYVILYNFSIIPVTYKQPRLLKISESGDKIWEIGYFDRTYYDKGTHLEISNDGGLLLSGIINSNFTIDTSYILKTNISGVPEWIKYFEYDSNDYIMPSYIKETHDNGYYLVGTNKTQKLTMLKTSDSNSVYDIDFEEITNIDNNLINNLFTIYPNPASDHIIIELDNIKSANIILSDLTGRSLFSKTLFNDFNEILLNDLRKGIYIIKLTINNKTFMNKLIITGR